MNLKNWWLILRDLEYKYVEENLESEEQPIIENRSVNRDFDTFNNCPPALLCSVNVTVKQDDIN